MRFFKSVIIVLFVLSIASSSHAAEYYRKHPQKRFLGSNQGNVGSCQSEADVAAIESVFAANNFPVKLSSFYRHARNWVSETDATELKKAALSYNDADKALIARAGAIVPDYMFPEDTEGYNPYNTGFRPHVSDAAVVDSSFATAESMGYQETYYSFKTSAGTWYRNLDQLKADVAAGAAVSVSIQGKVLMQMEFDGMTGLLSKKYDRAAIQARVGQDLFLLDPSHALAVVGWDDTLYADQGYSTPGALIVRNSWNDGDAVAAATLGPYTPVQLKALQSFRFKLNPSENLPGYLAIPYEYILDHYRSNIGGYTTYSLDWAKFAEQYARLARSYNVVTVPFACEGGLGDSFGGRKIRAKSETMAFGDYLAIAKDQTKPKAERDRASEEVLELLRNEGTIRFYEPDAAFKFAKVPRSASVDRAADFYAGKFRDYYCPNSPHQWPYTAHYADSRYRDSLERLAGIPYDQRGWYSVLNALYKMGAYNDQQ